MNTITTFLAVIVAFVALQQFLLARERFKLDLFDRRFAIFKATQVFVNEIICHRSVSASESSTWIQQFSKQAQTATFLFDDDLSKFLDDLWKKGNVVAVAYNLWSDPNRGEGAQDAFQKAVKIQEEMIEVQNHLEERFSKYLKFSNWKYGFIFGISN
jgi:hypothetical protein